ncbi:MAG TPA: hypothetical protein VNN19_12750 [bacterium]|nr:hypothetical protein [bacterium]
MRRIRILSGGLIAALLVTFLTAGLALGDDDHEVEVTGIVTSVSAPNGFQFRELASNAVWSAVLRRDAKIELKGGRDADRHYQLVVGDIVEVQGRLLAARTLLTKKVKVLAHGAAQPAPAPTFPPSPSPAPQSGGTVPAIIKTIGIGAAVKAFAPALNTFINKLVQAKDPTTLQTTKVVPILSLSIGVNAPGQAAIGAAQVSGPQTAVERVQAVAAIEGNYQGSFSIRALVPVDSLEPWKAVRRVPGVGVTAIIDLKL